jgi:hypothetical protein
MRHAVFTRVRDVLEALHHCCGDGQSTISEVVFESRPGAWAVKEDELKNFTQFAKQYGWAHTFTTFRDTKSLRRVPLASLLAGQFHYVDPLSGRGGPATRESDLLYNPFNDNTEYIVGARDDAEAQRLLDLLRVSARSGIQAVPLALKPAGPYHFFWLLSGDAAPHLALREAPRAWWGPAGAGSNAAVYVQWPYSIEVPDSLLQRIPWGKPQSLVLLNKDQPEVLIVEPASTNGPTTELVEVGELTSGHVATLTADDTPNESSFRVDLRLIRKAEPKKRDQLAELVRRRDEISLEIARLSGDIELSSTREPEPLHIYYSDSATEIPDELQRLLVEWTGQPGDLDAVQYLKLELTTDAASPPGLDRSYPVAHVLTTSAGLLQPQQDPTVGRRLEPYRPLKGARTTFQMLPAWEDHQLRLFVPRDHELELDPRLHPTPGAAEKLARALLGQDVQPEDFLILLVPGKSGDLTSIRVPAGGFCSLVNAFDWQCRLDIADAGSFTHEQVRKHAVNSFFVQLTGAFEEGVRDEALHRIGERQQECVAQLGREAAALKSRLEMVARLTAAASPAKLMADMKVEANAVATEIGRVNRQLESSSANRDLPSSAMTALTEAFARLETQQNLNRTLQRQIDDMRRKLRFLEQDQ